MPALTLDTPHAAPEVMISAQQIHKSFGATNVLRGISLQLQRGEVVGEDGQALLPEALPGLLAAATVTTIALVSYSAMSGVIGGGGLGDLALRYGYQRFQTEVMIVTVAILVILVQLFQWWGDLLVAKFTRK